MKLTSIAMLGTSNCVGLSSLLRAEACEEVSASTPIEAWEISDELLAEIYLEEENFRNWCNKNVSIAEMVKLTETLLQQNVKSTVGLLDILAKVAPDFRAIEGTCENIEKLSSNEQAFIGSANTTAPLNSVFCRIKTCLSAMAYFHFEC